MHFDNLPWLRVYGSQDYRNKHCPLEYQEQASYFDALQRLYPHLAAVAIHPPLEGKRSWGQVAWQKKQGGLNTGASDVIIPAAPVPFVCEIKRRDRTQSKWQPAQIDYLWAAHQLGAYSCVALGWEAAIEATRAWINTENKSP